MKTKVTSVLAVLMLLTAGAAPAAASAASSASATQAECSFPATYEDATGTEVTVEQRPERVTTLSPSAAQTMWELGADEQVVGVTQHAHYLDGAESRTNVSAAGQTQPSVEKTVSTDPDLVLAPNVVSNETVERLREAGLTVYKTRFATSLDDIYAKTERIGELTGNCEAAEETVSSMRDRVETVREAVENSDSPRVLVSSGGGYTAGQGTFVSNVVEVAGGTNIAVEANISSYQQISEEVVVEQDPEWIVQLGEYGAYPRTDAYNGTTAVQNDQIITVSNENISQPAPRVVNAIEQMAQAFHPEAYEEASASATDEESTTESPDEEATTDAETTDEPTTTAAPTTTEGAIEQATTTATESADDSTGGVPGFGVPAALAALAGAALLARRD